jgi:kinesin family protein 11
MTRNSLLKEYVAEIERLKGDLLAAREKNGIYFSAESWEELAAEQTLKETELTEAKVQVKKIEKRMTDMNDEYEESIALLKRREAEIQQSQAKIRDMEDTLRQKEVDLQRATDAYEQEVVVRQAHQETETYIDTVATGLKGVAAESLRDITGLYDKLGKYKLLFMFDDNAELRM